MMTRVEEPERGVVIVKDFKSDRKKENHKERKVREICKGRIKCVKRWKKRE